MALVHAKHAPLDGVVKCKKNSQNIFFLISTKNASK